MAESEWSAAQLVTLQTVTQRWALVQRRSFELSRETLDRWTQKVADMATLEQELRHRGRWISGPRDLMGVLEVEFDEVKHCRALAWLLNPNGGHGMEDRFLREFIADISLKTGSPFEHSEQSLGSALVVTEEPKGATRADIIVRSPNWTILIEAKIFAGEQPAQGQRLETLWEDEQPLLLFLTRTGRKMKTGSDQWLTYTWRDAARCLRRSLDAAEADKFSTAREYLKTLEAHLS